MVELSSYSRAASNQYLTTVELTRVIHDALRLVERSSDVRNARFETNVEPELFLNARTNEIQQVFVNLVKNAAEAVNELEGGGVVRIAAGRTGNSVWATVSDTGPGIDPEKQRIIFDPFYTTKAPGKGTGLGLNIVYRIVTKYRGTITVDSRPGQGALFELRFPVER